MKDASEERRETRAALPFVLPFVLVFGLLFVYPTLQMVASSFTNASLTLPGDWVGLANYERLLGDRAFWRSAMTTGAFAAMTVIPSTILGLFIAMGISRMRGFLQGLALALFFLPYILPASIIANFWAGLLEPDGLLGYPTELLTGRRVSLLLLNAWFLPTVAVITVWWTIGFNVLLFLAGLRAVPPELYEAATLDGASPLTQFRQITWPLVWPVTLLVFTLQLILQIKVFDQAYLLNFSGAAPKPLVQYIYTLAFQFNQSGYGATVALALFVLVVVISVFQFQLLRARGVR